MGSHIRGGLVQQVTSSCWISPSAFFERLEPGTNFELCNAFGAPKSMPSLRRRFDRAKKWPTESSIIFYDYALKVVVSLTCRSSGAPDSSTLSWIPWGVRVGGAESPPAKIARAAASEITSGCSFHRFDQRPVLARPRSFAKMRDGPVISISTTPTPALLPATQAISLLRRR